VDDPWLWAQVGLLSVLLLCSAFFSGSEMAFFSLNSLEKDALRNRTSGGRRHFVGLLFNQPDEVLVTILSGNMFVNVFATAISETLGARFFGEASQVLSIASMTLLLLLVGEMTPKNLAIRHSLAFSSFAAGILRVVHPALKPVVAPLGALRQLILSGYPYHGAHQDEARNSAVLSAIRMGFENKTIDHAELALLERFFRFREKTAADVMLPRIDAVAVDATASVGDLLQLFSSAGFDARTGLIPLYRNDVDHIAGYVRSSDLVPYRIHDKLSERVTQLMRPIHAVPASKRLRDLMEEMTELGSELAVVVDEYGGTEGLVSYGTMVDYLFDEFLPEHARTVQALPDGRYRFAGSVEVADVEETLEIETGAASRTIAGLIAEALGELPAEGASVAVAGYRFTVRAARGRRITWVEATREP
jgi:putative hemolysin